MIPKIYKRVNPDDFSCNALHASKEFKVPATSVVDRQGWYDFRLPPIGAVEAENDPKNTDGTFKKIIWDSIRHQYYSDLTKEHPYSDRTKKYISEKIHVFSPSYTMTGESIKPGSVRVVNSTTYDYELIDDGKGNLKKSNRSDLTDSFYANSNLVYEIDYNRLYPFFRGYIGDLSRDTLTGYYNFYSSVSFDQMYIQNGNFIKEESSKILLNDTCHCRIDHNPVLNFVDGTFRIEFSFKLEELPTRSQNIISARSVRKKLKKGVIEIDKDGNKVPRTSLYYEDEHVSENRYPFHFTIEDDTGLLLTFSRSDNRVTKTISTNLGSDLDEYHVQLFRYFLDDEYRLALFINGELVNSIIDDSKYAFNECDLLIGEINGTNAISVAIGDISFRNNFSISSSGYLTNLARDLYKMENRYESIIGNVFYRNGNIVLTPRFKSDFNYFQDVDFIEFDSIHTIYEYEVITRINKGDFNLTQNPTARIHKNSDILIPEFQNANLSPYITTVGLYNEHGDLIVIGKLSQPVQTRDDVDINILIRWSY